MPTVWDLSAYEDEVERLSTAMERLFDSLVAKGFDNNAAVSFTTAAFTGVVK